MDKKIPPSLRWACRRGMLELDILLGRFLEKAYPSLSTEDQKDFVELLNCSDQDLYTWLTGHQTPDNAVQQKMIARIKSCAP